MSRYRVEMNDGVSDDTGYVDSLTDVESVVINWVEDGYWGAKGAFVQAFYEVFDEEGEETTMAVDSGSIGVSIEPDHEFLINEVGGDTSCEHEWVSTYSVDGGLEENPGVWSLGGTRMLYKCHCVHCGLVRCKDDPGMQANPNETVTYRYEQLEDWVSLYLAAKILDEEGVVYENTDESLKLLVEEVGSEEQLIGMLGAGYVVEAFSQDGQDFLSIRT